MLRKNIKGKIKSQSLSESRISHCHIIYEKENI